MATEYQPRYQNSWALVVGINAYKHLPPLSYAGNDAAAIAAVLQNELNFPPRNALGAGLANKSHAASRKNNEA
jgi:hypothetical protein